MISELSIIAEVEESESEAPTTRARMSRINPEQLVSYTARSTFYYAEVHNLVRQYKDLQALRISTDERVRAMKQGRAKGSASIHEDMSVALGQWERFTKRMVESLIYDHPLYESWIARVRGVGPLSVGQLMGIVGTVAGNNGQPGIGAFDTVSKLWRFCGLGLGQYWMVDGKVVAPLAGTKWEGQGDDKCKVRHVPKPPAGAVLEWHIDVPLAGYQLPYSAEAKMIALEFIGSKIIMANGAYRLIYDKEKVKYHVTHPDWPDGRCHNAARRKMVKVWLSHLWHLWREAEGHSTRGLYVHEHGEHTTVYDWRDFVE